MGFPIGNEEQERILTITRWKTRCKDSPLGIQEYWEIFEMVFSVAIRGGKAKVAQRLSWRLCSATCSCNLFPLYGMCKEKSTFLLAPQACRHFCPPFNTGETYRLFSCDNIQFSSFFLPQGRELRPGSSSLAEGSTAKPQEFVSSLRALRWLSLQHCLPGDQEGASLR